MSEDIVGSHLKDFLKSNPGTKGNASGYGQNGSALPSSVVPGDAPKGNIPGLSVPTPTLSNANASSDNAALARFAAKSPKAHAGMSPRVSSEKVPAANVRKSRTDGVARPTK